MTALFVRCTVFSDTGSVKPLGWSRKTWYKRLKLLGALEKRELEAMSCLSLADDQSGVPEPNKSCVKLMHAGGHW
jgi:hypothetical protein